MPRVSGLTGTPTTRQGYRIITEAQGEEYHYIFRRVDDEDDEEKIVELRERFKRDPDKDVEADLGLKTTEAVEEVLEDRGISLA